MLKADITIIMWEKDALNIELNPNAELGGIMTYELQYSPVYFTGPTPGIIAVLHTQPSVVKL
jgi:hypothetical protein